MLPGENLIQEEPESSPDEDPVKYIPFATANNEFFNSLLSDLQSVKSEQVKTNLKKFIAKLSLSIGTTTFLGIAAMTIIEGLQGSASEVSFVSENPIPSAILLLVGIFIIGFGLKLHPSSEQSHGLANRRLELEKDIFDLTTEYPDDSTPQILSDDGELLVELVDPTPMSIDELLNGKT